MSGVCTGASVTGSGGESLLAEVASEVYLVSTTQVPAAECRLTTAKDWPGVAFYPARPRPAPPCALASAHRFPSACSPAHHCSLPTADCLPALHQSPRSPPKPFAQASRDHPPASTTARTTPPAPWPPNSMATSSSACELQLRMMLQLTCSFRVDQLADSFIARLASAVAIPSVSADPDMRPNVFAMADFLEKELKALGASVEKRALGKQPDKGDLDLPPVILSRYGNDSKKRTILVYGHYDVQPALKEDGWATDPFKLSVDEKGRMYGRGSTDDKGPV